MLMQLVQVKDTRRNTQPRLCHRCHEPGHASVTVEPERTLARYVFQEAEGIGRVAKLRWAREGGRCSTMG